MELPFSRLEFLLVFLNYNESIWPAQLFATAFGIVAVALLFFSAINAAGYLFGALFVIAALIFFVEGTVRNRIRFEISADIRGWCASALIAYGLVIYPLLGLLATNPYPETPLFGVVPCPTTIFTLGLLTVAKHPRSILLGVAPVLWAAMGGTAAFLLDVPQDWALFIAGLVWPAFSIGTERHLRGGTL